jgi:hypothetical protein
VKLTNACAFVLSAHAPHARAGTPPAVFARMLNTVKEIIYTVGDSTGAFAKSMGLSSVDLAKTIGAKSVDLAEDIGPKRLLIGAAIVAAAVGGGIILLRYLRRREAARLDEESMRLTDEAAMTRNPKVANAERRAVNAANAIGR